MTVFSLLELPEELIVVRFCSHAYAAAIDQASLELAHIIENTIELRYLLELGLAGMIDGPPGPSTVRDRLQALRECKTSWSAGKRVEDTEMLSVERAPAPFYGLAKREEVIEGIRDGSAPLVSHQYAIDYNQDLFAYIWDMQASEEGIFPKCSFASLSHRYEQHPLAARLAFMVCLPVKDRGATIDLRCCGDLIEWTTSCIGHESEELVERKDMILLNWKTGVIVWHMHGTRQQQFCVISSTQLVVIDSDGSNRCALRLYSFDLSATIDCPPMTDSDCQCVLALPMCTDGVYERDIVAKFEPQPNLAPDDKPFFSPDPDVSLLVLRIYLWQPDERNYDEDKMDWRYPYAELFLLMVPLETLISCTSERRESLRGTVVPWQDWGPGGTRMVSMDFETWNTDESVFGSRVALYEYTFAPWSKDEDVGIYTLYEVHKLANESVPVNAELGDDEERPIPMGVTPGSAHSAGQHEVRGGIIKSDDDWITDVRGWAEPIHTTFPFRKTVKVIRSPRDNSDQIHLI
ncbi:hypothetical protein BN946_scf184969.g66 [Trametes cinnabarina]|uniref:F-box domain-containing protein n=1 Tax=Pycnoporus cinnabarinus TaxID=5643 RepID=A0A060STJ3_PYCCI|nr:hypothetical protein BN946_scf184969.g66 [Trametes cinnabarina]